MTRIFAYLKGLAPSEQLTFVAAAMMFVAILVVIPLAIGLAFGAPYGLGVLAVMLLWQAKVLADVARDD